MDEMQELEEADDRLLEIQNRYTAAREHASAWRKEAREAFDFYAGRQWSEEDRQKLEEQQRVPVTFNRVAILIDAVIGYEVNNRQETRYIPRTPGDAKVNELLTEAANYFRDQCDAEFEESDAFRDMCITGMGWTNDRLSAERNPEFDLVRDRTDPLRMLWDPSARKPNLEDARYVFYEADMSKDEAKALVPEWDGEYRHADWLWELESDTKDSNTPRNSYKGGTQDGSPNRDVRVLEYQWCEDKLEHVITNPATKEQQVLDEEAWDELEAEARQAFSPFHATRRKRVWRRIFMIGSEPFEKQHPFPSGPTYHCVTGKRDRNNGYWFGIVRNLKDPQMWSNKWLSQLMHLLNSSAKSGYDIEKGAIDNIASFEAKAAKPGALNVFTDGALQQGRVQRREAVALPPDLANLLQYANDSMSDVSGINQELLGMADREQAGVLEYQRKQSAVTLLAPLFDSFRRYRKIAGRCWLYFMQNYISDGRLIRITKDDGGQMNLPFAKGQLPNPAAGQPGKNGQPEPAVISFFDQATSEYDVIVDQGSSSPNLKEATWGAIQPLLPIIGDRLGPEEMALILEYSPMPESFLEKYKAINEAKAQQPPPPDPEMMKVEAQIKGKQAELQIKAQEKQMEAQLKEREFAAELAMSEKKMAHEAMLEERKAQNELRIAMIKAQNDIQIARYKAQQQAELQAQSVEANNAIALRQAAADNYRADYKTEADVERMNKVAKAKAKAKPKVNA